MTQRPVQELDDELFRQPFSRQDAVLLTRQLGEMLESGVNLPEALETLCRTDLGEIAGRILGMLQNGAPLSQAFDRASSQMPRSVVVLVRIGEETGALAAVLKTAGNWLEADLKLVRDMRAALFYPLFVLAFTAFLTVVLLTTSVPRLIEVIVGLGAELSWSTSILAWLCWLLAEPAFWFLSSGLGILLFGFLTNPNTKPKVLRWLSVKAYPLPIIGPILLAFYHTRFTIALSALLEQGTELLKAVQLSQEVTEAPRMMGDIEGMRNRLASGVSLSEAMAAEPEIYDQLLVSFVTLGEESSSISDTCGRVTEMYRLDFESRVEQLQQALEPILTLMVGGIVTFVLLSTLLPLYKVITALG